MERRRQREEIYRMYESGIITPREMWEALQSWQSVGTGAGSVMVCMFSFVFSQAVVIFFATTSTASFTASKTFLKASAIPSATTAISTP